MVFEGRLLEVVKTEDGISKNSGKPWMKVTYKFTTLDKYPREVGIEVFGEERIGKLGLQVGQVYSLGVEAESRFWTNPKDGKVSVFTTLSAYALVDPSAALKQPAQPDTAQAPQQEQVAESAAMEESTELPF